MSIVAGLISSLSLTVMVVVSYILYVKTETIKKDSKDSLVDVVNQINNSQLYAYNFDKNQESNIQNLDVNLATLKKATVTKDDINTGVDYVKAKKLQLGDQHTLSGVGDVHSGGKPDGWLRFFDKDGKDYHGGVAMANLWTRDNAYLNGTVSTTGLVNSQGNLYAKGGISEHNPGWGTHFPWAGDNKNYIRGDTEIRGNTNNIGDMNVGRNLNVQGRIHFTDPTYDKKPSGANSTDSYYLEKKVDANNVSSLRLTLSDDNDESLQIWGGSCAAGDCAGQGTIKHRFTADGNAWTDGWVDSQNVKGRDHVMTGNWATWMRNNGDMHASNRLGVGISPDAQGPFKLFVDGGQGGQWSSLVRHGPTHVYMDHPGHVDRDSRQQEQDLR